MIRNQSQIKFFKNLSKEKKRDYLLNLTRIGNNKVEFITVLYKYLSESLIIQDFILIIIYEFLQKLFNSQKDIIQKKEIEKMRKFMQKNQRMEKKEREEADELLVELGL